MKIIKLTNHNRIQIYVNAAHIKLIMPMIADPDWPLCKSLVDLVDDSRVYALETPEQVLGEIMG